MTEEEFLLRWETERAMYKAWGDKVVSTLKKSIEAIIHPVSADIFIRIPVSPRIKRSDSLLEKAFYRKAYSDAYSSVTDKIGVRYVVLLWSDVGKISQAIESSSEWEVSKDRDHEIERDTDPVSFGYSAVHYVVRPLNDISSTDGNITIIAGTPCEIQIKTILQHAYSELTHDTIYKPQVQKSAWMERAAAKSMALLEATNDYFEQLSDKVVAAVNPAREVSILLREIYEQNIGIEAVPLQTEGIIIQSYSSVLPIDLRSDLVALFLRHPYLRDTILIKANISVLFRQPAILIVYLLADSMPEATKSAWPFSIEQLRPIFTDLGISLTAV